MKQGAVAILLTLTAAFGQSTARLSGTVHDPSGATVSDTSGFPSGVNH